MSIFKMNDNTRLKLILQKNMTAWKNSNKCHNFVKPLYQFQNTNKQTNKQSKTLYFQDISNLFIYNQSLDQNSNNL